MVDREKAQWSRLRYSELGWLYLEEESPKERRRRRRLVVVVAVLKWRPMDWGPYSYIDGD